MEYRIPHQFTRRPYQQPAWDALKSGKKRVVCCWHRGAGKDLFALNYLIWKACQKPAVYLHCFPKYNQGKKAIWNSVHDTEEGQAMAYLDHFPPELIKHKNSSDMRIEMVNGSVYCVMGIDGKNATQARGMNPSFVILSEYAYMDPESWYTLEPRVAQNNGTALFLSTPNGQNHFYHLHNYAMSGQSPDYFGSMLTIDDTHTLSLEHIENLRKEGIPEDFIQQEYYCNFSRGAEGAYYGKQIQEARDDERITKLKIQSDLPCHTCWDIGIGDSSAIWIFQQSKSDKLNFMAYYENTGEGLEHYIRWLNNWASQNKTTFGKHYVPHDMANREFTSGISRIETARGLGFTFQVVPRSPIDEGIQAVRSMLSQCSFDIENCKRGIQCLDFYRKKYNETLKVYYDEPLHDQYSHGADAMRCGIMGLKQFGTSSSMNKDQIKDLNRKFLGYQY